MDIENNELLYGKHTQQAHDNFNISSNNVNIQLIYALVVIKKAAAITNKQLSAIDDKKADLIISACDKVLKGTYDDCFITNPLQGGAGTSTNMNVNEVIASLASKESENSVIISPLDDVNKFQSTNDVYPTALRIAAINLIRALSDECSKLQESLQKKELEFKDIFKLGRTELMDALPITLGQEFGAYAQAISRDRWRIYKVEERLRQVNLGGTAIGTGSNSLKKYSFKITEVLRQLTGIGLARAEYPIDLTQNNDVFVEASGLLKALAVNLMKISNDLRFMNSGPCGGLGEITLAPLQAGSSVMPSKVNPIIPEMITQVSIKVMSNDFAITTAAASGHFELNAFLPLIADCLLESLELLIHSVSVFRTKCIDSVTANQENCLKHLNSPIPLLTSLVPAIGYDNASEIGKKCNNDIDKIKQFLLEQNILSQEELNNILSYKASHTYL